MEMKIVQGHGHFKARLITLREKRYKKKSYLKLKVIGFFKINNS